MLKVSVRHTPFLFIDLNCKSNNSNLNKYGLLGTGVHSLLVLGPCIASRDTMINAGLTGSHSCRYIILVLFFLFFFSIGNHMCA